MVLIGYYIFVFFLFIISGSITFVIFSNTICKKSFQQIYDDLSKHNQTNEKKIQTINNLYSYIQEYSDEEILIFNFRFNRFKSNRFYSAIFIVILGISILAMLKFELSSYGIFLIVVLICIGYFLPIIFTLRRFGILGFDVKSIQNLLVMFRLVLFRVSATFSMFIISILLLLVILNQFVELKTNTSFFDVFTPYINYGLLESINSNQLSLAGFFFTFAIGGTIIFSVTSKYLMQKRKVDEMCLKDAQKFEKWFVSNKYNISFKFHDVTKINSDNIKHYHQALSNLRSELNVDSFNKLILPVRRYNLFYLSVFGMYLMGILTLLLTQSFINLLCVIFIVFSALFILLLTYIFRDYN